MSTAASSAAAPTAIAAATSAADNHGSPGPTRNHRSTAKKSAATAVGGNGVQRHGQGDNGSTTSIAIGPGGVIQVPLVKDTLTFDGRQASRLRDMERRAETELRRKKRELEREIERMRSEFVRLFPSDRRWSSEETLHHDDDPLVAERCGSTDILDEKKMRTLFVVDGGKMAGLGHQSSSSPIRYYRIRFDVNGFDPKTVRVSTDGDRIVVYANKAIDPELDQAVASVNDGGVQPVGREYCRKIQKPKDVDHAKFRAYLTSDSVLIVEAPLSSPHSIGLPRKVAPHSPSHQSSRSISPSGSPATGGPDTPSKDKIGVPVFRDENGQRRLHLIVDIGSTFRPDEIIVQVIKDNKIQVRAKHEEKTNERLSKSKFMKEYELSERIETYSLTGGLVGDGRLIVGAYAKGHGEGYFSRPGHPATNQAAVNGGSSTGGVPPEGSAADEAAVNTGSETTSTAAIVVDEVTGDRKSVAVEPCEVRPAIPATSGGS